jgi:hypothetical protein
LADQERRKQETTAEQQQAFGDPVEPVQAEPLEELDIEQIQETIEFLQMLLSDEQAKQQMLEEEGEQAWQEFSKMIGDWMEELNALL